MSCYTSPLSSSCHNTSIIEGIHAIIEGIHAIIEGIYAIIEVDNTSALHGVVHRTSG